MLWIEQFIKGLPFWGNPFLHAALLTILLFFFLLLLGIAINIVNYILRSIFATFLGGDITFIFANYLTWPGTVHHELSHALFAFLTGAKVHHISVLPHGLSLGHVNFSVRGGPFLQAVQRTLTSIAPILCGVTTEILLWYYVFPHCSVWWHFALLGYLMISIILHMTLSIQDLLILWQGLFPSLLVSYVLILILEFLLPRVIKA